MIKRFLSFIKNLFKDYFNCCESYYISNSDIINDFKENSISLSLKNLNYNALTCWLLENTGNNSAKYLCRTFMNLPSRIPVFPEDYDDYIECYNFMRLIPDNFVDNIITTASNESPYWRRIFERWDELERQLMKNTEKSKDRIEDILYECSCNDVVNED